MKQAVIYISKQMKEANISTTHPKMFPFLNSTLFDAESKKRLSFDRIHGICNHKNIQAYVRSRPICKSFLFFGRSNVGKSTLINKLIGVPVNETSKKPGKTKELVFLKLNTVKTTFFVDAPGYGYASAASKEDIKNWGKLVEIYLKDTRPHQGENIFILLDINHGIKLIDAMLMEMLEQYKRTFILVFTKCDKAKKDEQEKSRQVIQQIQQRFSSLNFYVHYTSSKEGFGIEELRNHIFYRIITSDSEQN